MKLEKILTKNLVISILAGLFIVAGAFWSRLSDSTKKVSIKEPSNPSNMVVYQKEGTEKPINLARSDLGQNDAVGIRVADLPSVNGKSTDNGRLARGDLATQKPSGSTLAYDDLRDKTLLYTDGVGKYSAKNIVSEVTTNRASLLAYGSDLTKAIRDYPFYNEANPTQITFEAYKSGNVDDSLAKLETTRLGYELAGEKLLTLKVPRDLVKLELKLANSLDRTAQLIRNMEKVETDKLLALSSARQYVEESKFTINILAELNSYFKEKNISLGEESRLKLAVDNIN